MVIAAFFAALIVVHDTVAELASLYVLRSTRHHAEARGQCVRVDFRTRVLTYPNERPRS